MWVARDKNGSLSIYMDNKPIRKKSEYNQEFWTANGTKHFLDDSMFPELTWEDEPLEVELNIISGSIKERYYNAQNKIHSLMIDYKHSLIAEVMDIVKSIPNEIGLGQKYEDMFGYGQALTLSEGFGGKMSTFGTIERFKDIPRYQPAENLSIDELEHILDNVNKLIIKIHS